MFRTKSAFILGACTVILAIVVRPDRDAMAQETDPRRQPAAEGLLEEIIVTARRREEGLMETPISISAFTRAELAARQINRAHQIAESTPNLTFRNTRGQSNIAAVVYIRGIGQRDFIPTTQPGVGLYADGVYLSGIIGSLMDIMDIESIEVLRGPQGTLFGRNTIGGAIQVTSVKPSENFSADLDLLAGNFNRRRIKASVNIPFSDNFFGKFSGLWHHKDGYIDTPNVPGDDGLGSDDTSAGRVALRWAPIDSLLFDFTTDFSRIGSDGPPRVLGSMIEETDQSTISGRYNLQTAPALGTPLLTNAAYFVPRESYTNMGSYYVRAKAEMLNFTLAAEWKIGGLTLKSITSDRDLKTFDGADGDHGEPLINHVDDLMDGQQFSQEFQLAGTGFEDRLQWVTGVYYFENQVVNLNPVHFPGFSLMSGSIVDNESSAVFGQVTYDVTDKMSLTLGGRYTDENLISIVDDRHQFISSVFDPTCVGDCAGPTPGVNGPRPGVDGYRPLPLPPDPAAFRVQPNNVFRADVSGFDPHINIAYEWTDDLLTYVSYSEGFKGGGFTQRVVPGKTVDSFGPEYAKVYELGAKWSGIDDRLRVTGAAFFTDYTDLQVAVTRTLGGTIENAGDAEIKGGELEVIAAVTSRLQASIGLGYMDGKYTDLDPAATVPIGNRMPSIMDWQRNASLAYRMPLQFGELISRVDYSYVGDHFDERDNIPSNFVPSYNLTNVGVTFIHESDRWELSLQGRNVTDELYHTSTFLNGSAQGYTTHLLEPPAQWSARFKYNFFD